VKDMIDVESLRLIRWLVSNLLGADRQKWLVELPKFLRKDPCWVKPVVETAPVIEISSVQVPDLPHCHAKDKFVLNFETAGPGPKMRVFGVNFINWFLESCLTEGPVSGKTVDYFCAPDGLTPSELGVVSLSTILYLMEKHSEGQAFLLADGRSNYFHVSDGVYVREVCVFWRRGGWNIHAEPITKDGRWTPGSRVFSSKS